MAQIMHYRCDRCGFLEVDPPAIMRLVAHPSENIVNFPFYPEDSIDLCRACEKAFVKWLKQEPARWDPKPIDEGEL